MTNYVSIVNKILAKYNYTDESVIAVILYGSRVTGGATSESDLDIAVFHQGRGNYKIGTMIDGIRIDLNIYSIFDVYDIAYQKKNQNSRYFISLLSNGLVLKDTDDFVLSFKKYVEEISFTKKTPKRLNDKYLLELEDLYSEFKEKQNDYTYFNLLEKIRMAYHYLKNCSYLSMTKVYDVYSKNSKYGSYDLKLPSDKFISLFMEAIKADSYEERIKLVEELMEMTGITFDDSRYFEEYELTDIRKVYYDILVIKNKIDRVIQFIKNNHPFKEYSYNVLLYQLNEFCRKLLKGIDVVDFLEQDKSSDEERIAYLNKIYALIIENYHFDYEDYMLKLFY